MLSRWRHIGKMLLVALLVMSCTSCARWREAKAVVSEADSSLVEGVVIRDTAALGEVINALENPLGRMFAREELTKAYYLMGRNLDDYCHNFSDAADFYIKADRLETKDWVLRGRINSCMGFICKQDSCFAEALEFYERANNAFEKTGDKRRVANGLVSIAEQYVNLKDYAKVDSVLKIAAGYDIDSAYYADIMDVKAIALYNQQIYDSALVLLLGIKDYPRNIEARCYSYMKIMQSYAHLHRYSMSTEYANYILDNTSNPVYRTNAYYCLLKHVEHKDHAQEIANYSYLRKDEDRKLQYYSVLYAEASNKIKTYLENPHPYDWINWCIFSGIILICLLILITYILYKHRKRLLNSNTTILQAQEEQRVDRRKLLEKKLFDNSIYFIDTNLWKDSRKLRVHANTYCENIFYRLEDRYHLSEHEQQICLMVILEYSREQMAAYLHVQPNTISKTKNKIAKQLGTQSSGLREFLLDFLVS